MRYVLIVIQFLCRHGGFRAESDWTELILEEVGL